LTVEASAIPAPVGLARTRIALGAPLLRIRSDEQLVSLFRAGSEEAFRAIHDRYRQRMFAYTRQMLAGSPSDAEDAVQEIFVRAYAGLRASHRQLALRAWLYRIAHNRCIDELRRPQAVPTDEIPVAGANAGSDPVAQLEQRDALRRLIADVQRLPEQQRSALLMRELAGMTYADVSGALGVSVPAVKSLLVRARVGLAQASEARDMACARIREDMIVAHDRGVRASGLTRRHLRDCPNCRQFRSEVRGVSRQLAAFVPALGPLGVIAKLLGIGGAGGGGAAAGSGAMAGGGASAATGAAAGTGLAASGAVASVGAIAGATHVVTILAAAVVTAGGALELQHIAPPVAHHTRHHRVVAHATPPAGNAAGTSSGGTGQSSAVGPATFAVSAAPASPAPSTTAGSPSDQSSATSTYAHAKVAVTRAPQLPLSETANPDHMTYINGAATTPTSGTRSATTTGSVAPAATTSSSTSAGTTASTGAGTGTTTGTSATTGTATGTSTTTGASGSTTSTGTATGTTGSATGSSGTTGTSGATGTTGTTAATGTTGTTSGATSRNGSAATVTRAASTGSSGAAAPTRSGRTVKHSGAVAVFTVTGN
jgi:RNA polymerase sigma factor (sigma-70 family)